MRGRFVPRAEFSHLLIDGQIQFVTRGEILQNNDVILVPVAEFNMPLQSALNLLVEFKVSTT